MRLLIPDPEVIRLGTGYLQIIALTFVFTGISQCFNTVLRSVNRANEPLKVSVIAFFTNVFFNYIFIFGKFGAPALGVVGAAIGTLIARVLEIALLSWMIWYVTATRTKKTCFWCAFMAFHLASSAHLHRRAVRTAPR